LKQKRIKGSGKMKMRLEKPGKRQSKKMKSIKFRMTW
jgi:hypothetical protein